MTAPHPLHRGPLHLPLDVGQVPGRGVSRLPRDLLWLSGGERGDVAGGHLFGAAGGGGVGDGSQAGSGEDVESEVAPAVQKPLDRSDSATGRYRFTQLQRQPDVRMTFVVLLAAAAIAGCSGQTPMTATAAASSTTTSTTPAAATSPQLPATSTPSPTSDPAPTTQTRATSKKTAATKRPARQPKLTCEPHAPARLAGNIIVNKACPGLNAAKARAQGEYATSGDAQADWERQQDPGRAALQACREQTGMSTAECIADAKAGNAN